MIILLYNGIYTTEAEPAGKDETGTSLYGLKTITQAEGVTAEGRSLSVSQLQPNNIISLIINGEDHFSFITGITNTKVYLADPSLGNINMT